MVAPNGYNLNPQTNDAISLASLYLRTAGFPDTPLNRQLLAGWFWAESAHSGKQGVVVYNNNPLNITVSASNPNYHLFSNNSLHFGNYATPQQGAQAWANLLNSNHAYKGIVTALMLQDYHAFPTAIGHSPWGTSSSGVTAGVNYMLKISGSTIVPLPTGNYGGGNSGGGGGGGGGISDVVLHFFPVNNGKAFDVRVPVGTKIDQAWIDSLANQLNAAGVFGGNPAGDYNPVDELARAAAYDAFKTSLKPLIGTTTTADFAKSFGSYVQQGAASQAQFPDISGITKFFTNLNTSNLLHVAAIPAGAILLFFGARLMLGSAGVGGNSGGGGGTNTVVQTRSYPVFMRGN